MRRDDELLAAYVDGVSELTVEERRRVEALLARDPAARADEAATREVLDQLRSIPAEGTEPDWTAMERAIRDEVGPAAPARPWWRWLVPATALVLAAAAFALWLQSRGATDAPQIALPADAAQPVAPEPAPEPATDEIATMPLWLDGEDIEIDLLGEDLLEVDPALLGEDHRMMPGLLPVVNLAWIDELDLEEIEVAEAWLGRKKG